MNLKLRHSLLISLGIVMATITLLAFGSIATSLFIADTIKGQATAINESGALRMRSYRIASSLVFDIPDDQHWQTTQELVNEFEEHLHSPNIINIIPPDKNHPLRIAYNNIENEWQDHIKPIFDIYLDGIADSNSTDQLSLNMMISQSAVINLRNRYFFNVSDFVNDIDYLVSLLEKDSEEKVQRLQIYQAIALVLTILLVIGALILVYKRVHMPMQQLLSAAMRVRKRDFSFHTNYTGLDELGQLGTAFNSMADDLSASYRDLEDRVRQKTIDLERSNQSMELLYKTLKRLNAADSPSLTFPTILRDIEELTGLGRGAICLSQQTENRAAMLASTLHDDNLTEQLCKKYNCDKCMHGGKSHELTIKDKTGNSHNIITIPISDKNQQYGVLILDLGKDLDEKHKNIEPWQQQLLESIAGHIGIAINMAHQQLESRRLVLMEERGAIARELHDSLAQSLTFMKIQVSRLQAILKKSDTQHVAEDILVELRLGLNSAYKELRELLTTFRLRIDGEDFNQALLKTVIEFNDKSNTFIACDNRLTYCNLTPNEEIHVLQIIREALSNIVQHAAAITASLTLQYTQTEDIQVIIEDNGIGLPIDTARTHHYGLSIMNERAKTLNGQLVMSNREQGGTIISLTFSPTFKTTPVNLRNKV